MTKSEIAARLDEAHLWRQRFQSLRAEQHYDFMIERIAQLDAALAAAPAERCTHKFSKAVYIPQECILEIGHEGPHSWKMGSTERVSETNGCKGSPRDKRSS